MEETEPELLKGHLTQTGLTMMKLLSSTPGVELLLTDLQSLTPRPEP